MQLLWWGSSAIGNLRLEIFVITVYTWGVTTKVFRSGNSLAVRLPRGFELPCGDVTIRREGRRVVIEEMAPDSWPDGFFEGIRIDREDFGREQTIYQEKTL